MKNKKMLIVSVANSQIISMEIMKFMFYDYENVYDVCLISPTQNWFTFTLEVNLSFNGTQQNGINPH